MGKYAPKSHRYYIELQLIGELLGGLTTSRTMKLAEGTGAVLPAAPMIHFRDCTPESIPDLTSKIIPRPSHWAVGKLRKPRRDHPSMMSMSNKQKRRIAVIGQGKQMEQTKGGIFELSTAFAKRPAQESQ